MNNPESKINQSRSETAEEKPELTAEQKMELGKIWTELIVDNTEIPDNIQDVSEEELKKWLFDALMDDTSRLVEEWGLKPNDKLIRDIKEAGDAKDKAALELEYINRMRGRVDTMVRKFDQAKDRSTMWDSWPKKMRENKQFNCVGATLIGMDLLNRAGIESYCGHPFEHTVNIVRLANGDFYYIDLRSNIETKMNIDHEVIKSTPIDIDSPDIDYKKIVIKDNDKIITSILGNLLAIPYIANKREISDNDIEKQEAREYLTQHQEVFTNTESLLDNYLRHDNSNELIAEEGKRMKTIRALEKKIKRYYFGLSDDQKKTYKISLKSIKIQSKTGSWQKIITQNHLGLWN